MATRTRQMIETGSVLGYQAKFVDVDGIRTRYYEAGEGNDDVLVMVHGALFDGSSSANTWTLTFQHLSKRFHIFAADKLGSGMTDNPKSLEEYTQHHVTQHYAGFMKTVGVDQFNVVGQSNGAYTAARLALEHAGTCKSLVIVDSGTLGPPVGDIKGRREALFGGLPDPEVDYRGNLKGHWEALGYTKGDVTEEYLDAGVYMGNTPKALQTRKDLKEAGSQADAGGSARDKDETLRWIEERGLTMPVLLTWGYNDPSAILPIGHQLFDLVCKSTDRAQMHIFNHVGHFHYRELPEEWSSVVTNFIEHCTSPAEAGGDG